MKIAQKIMLRYLFSGTTLFSPFFLLLGRAAKAALAEEGEGEGEEERREKKGEREEEHFWGIFSKCTSSSGGVGSFCTFSPAGAFRVHSRERENKPIPPLAIQGSAGIYNHLLLLA